MEERLRTLEAALDAAIERAKAAKEIAKQAKDDAKLAKKDKKRARKALIEAQEEYGLSAVNDAQPGAIKPDLVGQRIADSPERRRRSRVKRKPVKPKSTDAQVDIDPSKGATSVAPEK